MATRRSPATAAKEIEPAGGFRGKGVTGKFANEVGRDECIAMLEAIAPVGDELKELLRLPDKLFDVSLGAGVSLSSRPFESAGDVANHLMFGTSLPSNPPYYGIHIGKKEEGGGEFCTFIDRRRKVIVYAPVRNTYDEKSSWGSFESALKSALDTANHQKSEGRKFDFVISREGVTETV
jgi:hypothetical protein